MTKTIASTLIAAAALVPTGAMAADIPQQSFTRQGQTYVYSRAVSHDREVIDGYSQTDGSRFHLVVRNGRVTGVSNGQPVSFRVIRTALPVQTAAR